MRHYPCFAALLLAAAMPLHAAAPAYHKEPAAIEILERGDAAIRRLPAVAFRADYVGTFTSRGRQTADVLLRRDGGADEAMGTIGYRLRADVTAADPPYGVGHLPRSYRVYDGVTGAALIDRAAATVLEASGRQRYALNGGAMLGAVPPQYVRPDPLKMEIEDSIGAAYLGTEAVAGVESHVVWLKFEPTSGFGEQLLYFGVEDLLLRKATLTAPRVVVREATGDDPEATYPSIHFDLTLHDLQVLPAVADAEFAVHRAGLTAVDFDDPPGVGDAGPQWTLRHAGGGTVSAADLRGEVAYLFFWASWCPTCHLYLPEVQRIHDEFDGVRVLAINAFDRDDALQYIRDLGYTFEVALDGDDLIGNRLRFIGQPALVILDRDGVIRHREMAPRRDRMSEVRQVLAELTGGSAADQGQ